MKNHIFVKANQLYHRIVVSDIQWIQSDGNYSLIYIDQKKFILKRSLTALLKELDSTDFIQIHKTYIVNKQKIEKLDTLNNQLFIGNQSLPIGRTYKSSLIAELNLF